jgi:hypothetical protein
LLQQDNGFAHPVERPLHADWEAGSAQHQHQHSNEAAQHSSAQLASSFSVPRYCMPGQQCVQETNCVCSCEVEKQVCIAVLFAAMCCRLNRRLA